MSKWLQGQSTHAHGYSEPQYIRIAEPADKRAVERAKESMLELLAPDRDGFREPVFKVLDKLPIHVLLEKRREADEAATYWRKEFDRLNEERNARDDEVQRLIPKEQFEENEVYVYDEKTLQLIEQHSCARSDISRWSVIYRRLKRGQKMDWGFTARHKGLWK